ncbi:MAG: MBL fold metallo-hydrolase [Proteobacteria bacterium]|nr:MBL fold metallo-hydrolase [Pseudomonadota bacterium]
MTLLGVLLPGCSQQLDLLKIAGKNFAYEISHPIKPPPAKLNLFPKGNPGTHVGWIGHSTILMSFAGFFILTDPNFAKRVVISRRAVGLPIEPEEIKELDLILISHAHYDHLDLSSLKRLPKNALLVVPQGCQELVAGLGFSKVIEMKWNDIFQFQGLTIEATQPAHWGKRSPFDNDHRGYNSYLLSQNGNRILFAGDTGYSRIFEVKGKEGTIDLAFLPISAYKPDWFRRNHASPEEALKMFVESGAKFMVPIHWGTFILSHEPLTEPPERLKIEAKRLRIEDRVIILRHGESFTVLE